jgi:lysophospholipase L1-like esterase
MATPGHARAGFFVGSSSCPVAYPAPTPSKEQKMRITRPLVVGLGALALLLPASIPAAATDASGNLPVPETITALGDSITAGVHVNRLLVTEPAYSWSTGTNTTVNSLSMKLDVLEPGAILALNRSKSGAKAGDLPTQAAAVTNNPGDDLVTILIGANDACTSTEAGMTPTTAFRASIDSTLATLAGKGVERVTIASIPDIYQLWSVYKDSSSARFTWGLYRICQSMLANPSKTDSTNEARRQRVRNHVIALNAELAKACTAAAVACRFDGGKVFATRFTRTDVSSADYFHPSRYGQQKLAQAAYDGFGPFAA